MTITNDAIVSRSWSKRVNRRFAREYAFYLQCELNAYVQPEDGESSLLRHAVQVIASPAVTIVTVEFIRRKRLESWDRFEDWLKTAASLGFTIFRDANDQAIAHQDSEQIMLNRNLGVHLRQREKEGMVLQICRPSNPTCWTNLQAWKDSNDAISLMLAERGTSH